MRLSALFPELAQQIKKGNSGLLVQDDVQERTVDLNPAVVVNEPQFSEFIHEHIDAGTRGSDHLREQLLGYFGKHFLRLILPAVARQE
jgi:hypothetical protein